MSLKRKFVRDNETWRLTAERAIGLKLKLTWDNEFQNWKVPSISTTIKETTTSIGKIATQASNSNPTTTKTLNPATTCTASSPDLTETRTSSHIPRATITSGPSTIKETIISIDKKATKT